MAFEILSGDTVIAHLGSDQGQHRHHSLPADRTTPAASSGNQIQRTQPATTAPPFFPASWCRRLSLQRAVQALLELFLPQGYPHSVGRGYLRFQLLDLLQGLCSYLRGVLSTRAVLSGLGVGRGAATAATATTQWVYRDGAGMIGGLLFTWLGAGRFGANVKGWRLFADVAVDLALTLEIVSPLLCAARHQCFTAVVCTASVLRAMCGVAAGATRAVITAFFAGPAGNLADVQAKEGSQETAVSLVGMIAGLWLTHFVDRNQSWVQLPWLVFVVLTVLHLVMNYLAVEGLFFPELNDERLSLLLCKYKMQGTGDSELSVESINASENFILCFRSRYRFVTGARPSTWNDIVELQEQAKRCAAFLSACGHRVNVVMRVDCEPDDVINAIAKVVLGQGNQFLQRIRAQGWRTDRLFLRDMGFRVQERTKSE